MVDPKAALKAGFTTVQDLGALNYLNLRLRDSIQAGVRIGPRVIGAGPWLGVSGPDSVKLKPHEIAALWPRERERIASLLGTPSNGRVR